MNKICINGFIPAKDARHAGTFSNVRKIAFTLAEVLVTLGIIGVVSAMTVPSLMQNHQRKTYVTQLHKVYNELSQAALQYMTDKNAINLTEAGLIDGNAIDAFMKKYFKIVQDCNTDTADCIATDYKKMDGTSSKPFTDDEKYDFKHYILANGSLISLGAVSTYQIQIHLDINGKKGPNILGRDTFALNLFSNGVIDDDCAQAPCSTDVREDNFEKYCISSTTSWWGCFGKILNDNWEMTY